ncbi:MAG: 1-deoxy-D-xylulose-5-phosphate synthase [Clostridia bacterium]|nr:1-deoxy-D-xylulose-5-phosphate synthase [Clostridia bacterium]
MLKDIKSPKDIKNLSYSELDALAGEIREKIIDTVAHNGGHLASNLGMVEATIALHRVFNTPEDKIVFDVSHQCYTHKLLTGRQDGFDSLRTHNGLSGFTNFAESEYDTVTAGHSGTSVSTALGLAQAAKIRGEDNWAVAVIGDGSFTNGMAYEALNNCGEDNLNLIILLNDNEMSISKNVGGMHHSLSTIRTSKRYFALKHAVKNGCKRIPIIGESLVKGAKGVRDFAKRLAVNYNIFESLGCDYIGPVNGHDIKKLEDALREAKTKHRASVVHIITKKGKGYSFAEENPEIYHSTSKFDKNRVVTPSAHDDFSHEFGKYMCERASKDSRICAVTAAMIDGTGLREFSEKYPDRFFDTAISEEHATTFSAGLAKAGFKPVFAVYSTFAQRIYDQIFHDCALQKLAVVLAVDRAGIVGADGSTHQGLYDYSLFSSIPGISIYSPETYSELRMALDNALEASLPTVVRYPRGSQSEYDRSPFTDLGDMSVMASVGHKAVIITYGKICECAYNAANMLKKLGIGVSIIKLIKIAPLDTDKILALCKGASLIYLLEEGIKAGSVSEKIASALCTSQSKGARVIIRAIDDTFVNHGSRNELLEEYSLDSKSIATEIFNALK